jgi:hypothetical protein
MNFQKMVAHCEKYNISLMYDIPGECCYCQKSFRNCYNHVRRYNKYHLYFLFNLYKILMDNFEKWVLSDREINYFDYDLKLEYTQIIEETPKYIKAQFKRNIDHFETFAEKLKNKDMETAIEVIRNIKYYYQYRIMCYYTLLDSVNKYNDNLKEGEEPIIFNY